MNKIATVVQEGRFVKVYLDGVDISKEVPQAVRLAARNAGKGVELVGSDWVVSSYDPGLTGPVTIPTKTKKEKVQKQYEEAEAVTLNHSNTADSTKVQNITQFIHRESVALKPNHFYVSDLKWKYLVRSAMRGKNIMMTGPAGTGKTMAVKHVVNALQRPFFYFNLGATQDPRTTLIGNTHFKKDSGTYFAQSLFVTAIQTQNAVILLDELSRAHPEAWNILMTVLDPNQRYLRLDEKDETPTINVADGVSFIATANIGNEYTATRTMDRALLDRFVVVEMEALDAESEYRLLKQLYPTADPGILKSIAEIANETREQLKSDNPKVTMMISTRMTVEMGALALDGFTLDEIAETTIYPFYDKDGGVNSERTYMMQLVQKYIKTIDNKLFNVKTDAAGKSNQVTNVPF